MLIELTGLETRVIGCLIEKQIATPDQYPLSLNALTNACNQKSNRTPVWTLDEIEVQEVVDLLIRRYQIIEHGGYSSRVAKYAQRFCNSEHGSLNFSRQEIGVICELFLRGAQTPGELRTHASRLCHYTDVREIEAVLDSLMQREDGPYVLRLPLEPGRRECRFMHLFSGNEYNAQPATQAAERQVMTMDPDSLQHIEILERRVANLEAMLAVLTGDSGVPASLDHAQGHDKQHISEAQTQNSIAH